MAGDPIPSDAARLGGVHRIAPPTLTVVVSTSGDIRHGALLASTADWLGPAIGRVRRDVPDLPLDVRTQTPAGRCSFAFRPSASPAAIDKALASSSDADTSSGVVGWDDETDEWVVL